MKPGKNVVRAIMLLLFLGAVAYFAVYAYHIFFGGYETATIYSYTGQSTLPAEGYLVRAETVLSDGGSLEEIVVAEGENVALGDVVARVYSSESALEQHRRRRRWRPSWSGWSTFTAGAPRNRTPCGSTDRSWRP